MAIRSALMPSFETLDVARDLELLRMRSLLKFLALVIDHEHGGSSRFGVSRL
jgi:hypothetical protein